MIPTGTSACCSKKYANANATALSGWRCFHWPWQRSCSVRATVRLTVKFLRFFIFGIRALIALLPLVAACMFDCPEQIQTSPTMTFLIESFSSVAAAMTVSSRGSKEAANGSSLICQRPFESAWPDFFCPANSTVTCESGLVAPQTGTGIARCSTALSVNGEATESSALAESEKSIARASAMIGAAAGKFFFICGLGILFRARITFDDWDWLIVLWRMQFDKFSYWSCVF